MKYRITFDAQVHREIDVPDDFSWPEAYAFARDTLGWDDLAYSAAAVVTIQTDGTRDFRRVE